jgi:hypothetical protein
MVITEAAGQVVPENIGRAISRDLADFQMRLLQASDKKYQEMPRNPVDLISTPRNARHHPFPNSIILT